MERSSPPSRSLVGSPHATGEHGVLSCEALRQLKPPFLFLSSIRWRGLRQDLRTARATAVGSAGLNGEAFNKTRPKPLNTNSTPTPHVYHDSSLHFSSACACACLVTRLNRLPPPPPSLSDPTVTTRFFQSPPSPIPCTPPWCSPSVPKVASFRTKANTGPRPAVLVSLASLGAPLGCPSARAGVGWWV